MVTTPAVAAMPVDAAAPARRAGRLRFPPDFTFGAATASFQIEGAAAEGGRGPSIWDDFSKKPGNTHNGATGDVACDHYHRFRHDVAIMASMGVRAYRFSISWSRLIPNGEGDVNEEGACFYSDLIDELLSHGITPWVTLYHWDMPSALDSEFGGWLGPKERVMAAFGAYARTCFSRFGDRVKNWITLNEPWCSAVLGYGTGQHAPGRSSASDTEPYIAAHNLLLAHAEAVRIFRSEFAQGQGGQIGISLNADFRQPRDISSVEDAHAALRAMEFSLGWFAEPVHFGAYPACMRSACGDRLPRFTAEESELLRGSSDFFGLNSYSANLAAACHRPLGGGGYWEDIGVEWWHRDPDWEKTDMDWPIVPWAFRELLLYVQSCYEPRNGIYITENGCALEPESSVLHDQRPGALEPLAWAGEEEDPCWEALNDLQRVRFFRAHLSAVHAARSRGADVRGYFAWSLLDNFEWAEGYSKRFGLVRVDYKTQSRQVKASGHFLAGVFRDCSLMAPKKEEQYAGATF